MKSALIATLIVPLILAAAGFGGPAGAQILDTEPDVIGFFAAAVGNVPGVCQPWTPLPVYLMITRPSDASGLTAYGCSFAVPPVVLSLGFVPAGGIIIESIFPVLDVGYATPLPSQGDTYILGTWNLMVTGTESDVVLLADHFPGEAFNAAYTAVASGSELIPVHPADWGNGMPVGSPYADAVLWVNEPGFCGYIVGDERTTWGGLKSLFR